MAQILNPKRRRQQFFCSKKTQRLQDAIWRSAIALNESTQNEIILGTSKWRQLEDSFTPSKWDRELYLCFPQ